MSDLCVLIPIYNNKATIATVVRKLVPLNLPCLIVNDGSDRETAGILERLAGEYPFVKVRHLPFNGGKGMAVGAGVHWARSLGYQGAIQIDADDQHCTEDIPKFAALARANPGALILGKPIFSADVPRARLYGRELSKLWVRIETLSGAIGDPLFGFRVYPVAATSEVMKRANIGCRMDFDPEIAVRLFWRGVPVLNIDTPVVYPEGGLSHFRMVRDNLRISWMHTRMVLGMLLRLPLLLWRKVRRP